MRVFPKLASAAGANKRNPAPISQNKICYTEAVLDKNSRTVNKLNVSEIGAGYPCSEKPAPRKEFRNTQ